jgi:hypothetical protein
MLQNVSPEIFWNINSKGEDQRNYPRPTTLLYNISRQDFVPTSIHTNMNNISRREFIGALLSSLLTFSLVRVAHAADAFSPSMRAATRKWLLDIENATSQMRSHKMTQVEWQRHIASELLCVDFNDLLNAIDYDQLAKRAIFNDDHETADDIDFSNEKGLSSELSFNPYFYAMHKGVSIVPHGHRNMSSMHMVIKGEARAWHFERVSTEKDHLVIRPTSDKILGLGEPTTVSDEHDNIHWFKALTEPVFIFSIAAFRIDPAKDFEGRECIDPLAGEKQSDGTIRAPRIDLKQAYNRYGRPS